MTCPRVIGSTADGKWLVTCGRPTPCPMHTDELTPDEAVLFSALIKVARSIRWTLDVVRDDEDEPC